MSLVTTSTQRILIIFGLPAAGKSYISSLLQREFGFYAYDGDNDLTAEMKDALINNLPITDEMRDVFFSALITTIVQLSKKYPKLVIAQTFIKDIYRKQLLDALPHARFILVKTNNIIREKRLIQRIEYPLNLEYSQQMVHNFEKPQVDHYVVCNDEDGVKTLKKQLEAILE